MLGFLLAFEHIVASRINVAVATEDKPRRHIVLREPPPDSDTTVNTVHRDGSHGATRFAVDADGFIMPSRIHAKADLTIAFVGGSTTECLYVDEEARFPYRVGRLLEYRLGRSVNSFNGGLSGNHSLHATFVTLGKVMSLEPRYVVLMEAVNDLAALAHLGSYWNDNPSRAMVRWDDRPLWLDLALRRLRDATLPHTWALANWVWHQRVAPLLARRTAISPERPAARDEFAAERGRHAVDRSRVLDQFGRSLDTFVAVVRVWGASPVLMTQFNRIDPARPAPEYSGAIAWMDYAELYAAMNDLIRTKARQHGVPLIDLDRAVPKSTSHLYDLVHLNSEASAEVAEIVTARLLDLER